MLVRALKDALARSSQRLVDLLRAWDEPGTGYSSRRDFFQAVRSLGLDASGLDLTKADTDAVFSSLVRAALAGDSGAGRGGGGAGG